MSIGRSREEKELTSLLSRTLVQKEVIEPMDKIGWSNASPPPPDYSGQPAAEGAPTPAAPPAAAPVVDGLPAPASATPPAADPVKTDAPVDLNALFESLRDPETGLIGRKYKTVEEAIKGNVHLVQMAKQSFAERDEALRKLQSIQTLAPAPVTPPQGVTAPQPPLIDTASRQVVETAQANLDAVLSEINENGGVLNEEIGKKLSRAQRELSEAVARASVIETRSSLDAKETAEREQWKEVDKQLSEKYPDSAKFAEEVALFVESDPLIASAVNALLREGTFEGKLKASELAWKQFAAAHSARVTAEVTAAAENKEAELAAREQVRQEQLAQARKDAGVVTGSVGGSGAHDSPRAAGVTQEEIDALREQMRREGDAPGSPAATRFRRAIIHLDPAIFGEQ